MVEDVIDGESVVHQEQSEGDRKDSVSTLPPEDGALPAEATGMG